MPSQVINYCKCERSIFDHDKLTKNNHPKLKFCKWKNQNILLPLLKMYFETDLSLENFKLYLV